MRTSRNLSFLLTGAVLAGCAGGALAQAFPTKAVRVVVGYPPGGGNDLIARAVSNRLADIWKQPVVVENKAGASGSIGADFVARSAPDGYNLLLTGTSHLIHGAMSKRVPYKAVDDFTAISTTGTAPMIIEVNPKLPVNTVQELIALAKTRNLNYGSAGTATSPHVMAELFARAAGIKMTHIPYKGSGPMQTDLIGGQIDLGVQVTQTTIPSIKANHVRGIAVTGRARMTELPNLPTVAESGVPGFTAELWWGFMGPANLPAPVLRALNEGVRNALTAADVQRQLISAGLVVGGSTPEEMLKTMRADFEAFAKLGREAGITAED